MQLIISQTIFICFITKIGEHISKTMKEIEDILKEYDSLVRIYHANIGDRMGKNGLLEYNEVLFSCHSCAIEGNSFSVDETRTLKEKGLGMIPEGKTLLEAFEMLDHFSAFEYISNNLDKPLNEELLKECHRLLTEHTLSYRTKHDENPSEPGQYTTLDMCAGDTLFGDHEKLIKRVPNLLASTQNALDEGIIHPMIIAAKFHGFFEYLHPFRDGNGRLGRLMTNFILLKKGHPILIIPIEKRSEYITTLKMIRKEATDEYLVRFFLDTAIERMQRELKEKEEMTSISDTTDFF